jgi:hypothetical protein
MMEVILSSSPRWARQELCLRPGSCSCLIDRAAKPTSKVLVRNRYSRLDRVSISARSSGRVTITHRWGSRQERRIPWFSPVVLKEPKVVEQLLENQAKT